MGMRDNPEAFHMLLLATGNRKHKQASPTESILWDSMKSITLLTVSNSIFWRGILRHSLAAQTTPHQNRPSPEQMSTEAACYQIVTTLFHDMMDTLVQRGPPLVTTIVLC